MPEGVQIDDGELHRTKAIVRSMTAAERQTPDIFKAQPTRLVRVAKGSGRTEKEVAELIQRFMFMRQMMGDIGQQAGLLSKIPGLKQMAAAGRMRDVVRTGGLEHNPMMANLASELLEAAVAGGGSPNAALMQQLMGGQAPKPARKAVDKQKKKADRKKQKAARRKSRK
jgi:signal recognition particle subunit SRP54